jgi:hypothetical protein
MFIPMSTSVNLDMATMNLSLNWYSSMNLSLNWCPTVNLSLHMNLSCYIILINLFLPPGA